MLGSSVGVFVGCIWSEYGDLLAGLGGAGSSQVVTGNGLAFMAGRVSYTFGLTGECHLLFRGMHLSYVWASQTVRELARDVAMTPAQMIMAQSCHGFFDKKDMASLSPFHCLHSGPCIPTNNAFSLFLDSAHLG